MTILAILVVLGTIYFLVVLKSRRKSESAKKSSVDQGTFFVGALLLIIVGLIIASIVSRKRKTRNAQARYACPMARMRPRGKPNP